MASCQVHSWFFLQSYVARFPKVSPAGALFEVGQKPMKVSFVFQSLVTTTAFSLFTATKYSCYDNLLLCCCLKNFDFVIHCSLGPVLSCLCSLLENIFEIDVQRENLSQSATNS